jgi:hypothetical protein
MKKVKFLTSIASHDWAYGPGDTAELETHIAEAWIEAGTCEAVIEEDKLDKLAKPAVVKPK